MAALVPHYEYNELEFFGVDDAPATVAEQRRAGFMRLAAFYSERFATTAQLTREVEDAISDLQFTDRYRVPFQFRGLVSKHLKSGSSWSRPLVFNLPTSMATLSTTLEAPTA